jgi:hypothetical protein
MLETLTTIACRRTLQKSGLPIQDYSWLGRAVKYQDWIDRIAKSNGSVSQFVALALGSGDTV